MFYLQIGSQNIQGHFKDKCISSDFVSLLVTFDIFGVQETRLTDRYKLNIPGYDYIRADKVKSKFKYDSRGVVVLYKSKIASGISKINSKCIDCVWIKCSKKFFNMEKDIYLCFGYIPPSNLMSNEESNEVFTTLQQEIGKFSQLGKLVIMGDLNSRLGQLQEKYVTHITDLDNLNSDIISPKTRNSNDITVNSNGKIMMNIINDAHLIVVNGRTVGDFIGNYTCDKWNGSSCVDLCIVKYENYNDVISYKVLSPTVYSDHRPISLRLKTNIPTYTKPESDLTPIKQYVWNENGRVQFRNTLTSDTFNVRFNNFIISDFKNTDEAVSALTEIINDAAKISLKLKILPNTSKTSKETTVKQSKNRNKYEKDISKCRRKFKAARRSFLKEKHNISLRQQFLSAKKQYRKKIKAVDNNIKEEKILELAKLEKDNSNIFWSTVKKMTSKDNKQSTSHITSKHWNDYFCKLLNVKTNKIDNQYLDYVSTSLEHIENAAEESGPLDEMITPADIKRVVKTLKNNKSVGFDLICNEMIKDIMVKSLTKLFNYILSNGTWPSLWKKSYIVPIHKSGDYKDPHNYRGIAVSSCLSKVLTKIMEIRLQDYMIDNKLWNKNQCSFMKGHRTEDNVFILKSLFHKYVKKKQEKIYVAFIDFRKFFDSLNRQYLMYKLIQHGITGKFYYLIKTMYQDTFYNVKTYCGFSQIFKSNSGVKQGCKLSPILANIYQLKMICIICLMEHVNL